MNARVNWPPYNFVWIWAQGRTEQYTEKQQGTQLQYVESQEYRVIVSVTVQLRI
jgi:hypothetical protein